MNYRVTTVFPDPTSRLTRSERDRVFIVSYEDRADWHRHRGEAAAELQRLSLMRDLRRRGHTVEQV